MADFSVADVKKLRERTGAGMMDAKKALTEAGGDIEAAVDALRAKGLATAQKKSSRTAAEGLVGVAVSGTKGVAVEVNSETDFVAKNDQFQSFVRNVTAVALELGNDDVEALKAAAYPEGGTVSDKLTDNVATIGENQQIRRIKTVAVEKGAVISYMHTAAAEGLGKIGVLVALKGPADKAQAVGKQIAMHIAATNPASLSQADLDPALIEREKNILTEQARESGKPEAVIEKMIVGRMAKFFEEVTLLGQKFVINPDITVAQASKDAGVEVTGFARIVVGEGIEKEDFAAEVAKTLAG
jgi:elongation factor Ts